MYRPTSLRGAKRRGNPMFSPLVIAIRRRSNPMNTMYLTWNYKMDQNVGGTDWGKIRDRPHILKALHNSRYLTHNTHINMQNLKYRKVRSQYRNVLLRTKGKFLKIRNLSFHKKPIHKIEINEKILYMRRWRSPLFASNKL